jgi:hypothetical protein
MFCSIFYKFIRSGWQYAVKTQCKSKEFLKSIYEYQKLSEASSKVIDD